MKKWILLFTVLFIQEIQGQNLVKIGTIYKEHPYIQTVKKLFDLGPKGDTLNMRSFYADTAKFYQSPDFNQDPKFETLNQTRVNWSKIYKQWEIISVIPLGPLEGYQYQDSNFTVKSIWVIKAIFNKTHKTAEFLELVLDEFNREGKISKESTFFDESSIKDAILFK